MKSFPSTLNESKSMYGSGKYESYRKSFDIDKLKAINLNSSAPVLEELLKEQNVNIANYNEFHNIEFHADGSSTGDSYTIYTNEYRENPLMLPYDVIALAKDYEWKYNEPAVSSIGYKKETKGKNEEYTELISKTYISPSMFNPLYGVNVRGITTNVPLLNTHIYSKSMMSYAENLSSCSIRELCALSKTPNSILGMATYKYADFMYCKDLGKVSNNHLITLRRFAHPVGDHIFELTSPNYISSDHTSYEQPGDVGRLVTWFGTDDNKLEDIIKYSYHATWKTLNAGIQQEDSVADDERSGLLGRIANTLSDEYTTNVEKGVSGAGLGNIWTYLGDKLELGKSFDPTKGVGMNNDLLRNYDQNRVYNPKNTIQSIEQYEGKIEFVHEFTLNFSYKLRAYDNINPKSAFLDLIGNILEVTGRRGRFWGGERKLIGPQVNMSFFKNVNNIIDNAFDKIGGIWDTILNSDGINFNSILGSIGDLAKEGLGKAKEVIDGAKKGDIPGKETVKKILNRNVVLNSAKGMLKNALGRPKMIAWHSLLSGGDTGLWHVTIGNPKNPIMVMGNLIVTDSSIKQSGPLGLDDFPSEITVSVSLKHARPRDITDISKMYTKGLSSIYNPLAKGGLNKYVDGIDDKDTKLLDKASNVSKSDAQTGTTQGKKDISNQSAEVRNNYMTQKDVARSVGTSVMQYDQKNGLSNKYNIPNPFIGIDDISMNMAQSNNYSPIMALLSADEVL